MVPDLNEVVKLMYMEVPSTLETIANNYSRVDRGQDITQVDNSLPKLLQDIPLSTEIGMRFQTAEVEQVKQKCVSGYSDVLEYLNELQTQITNLSWESDASDKFRDEFMRLKSKILKGCRL
jgi:DNA repair ATPase RecN